jgi:hypothetical protein
MKKEIIKPFDLTKAKAGAKLKTRGGLPVEIFKWDARGDYPIRGIVIAEKEDKSEIWALDGSYDYNHRPDTFDLVIVEEVEEPKFKVGDWITNGEYTCKIVKVTDICYECNSNKGSLHIKVIAGADEDYHLWTIKDAKVGDILVDTEGSVFIFRKICEGYPNAYGGINIINEFAHADESGYWTHKPCFPATKEQRDLLFQKMKEEGYEWNEEKFELKKIKPKFWSGDKSNTFGGFFINFCSDIEKVVIVTNTETNYNVFATEKQAKSALAMARISQIMANDIEHFGGVITDEEWENDEWKFVIYRCDNRIKMISVVSVYHFLAFHTEKQRDLFLEKYPQLVRDFLMISDEETK